MDDSCNIEKKYWTFHTPYDEVEPNATEEEAVTYEDGLSMARLNMACEEVREVELQKQLSGEP